MASADENAHNSGNGAGQRRTIRIPIPRNLPPGQRYAIRLNIPANLAQGGNRIQLVNVGQVPAAQQGPDAAGVLHQLQQQQRERMEREDQLRQSRDQERIRLEAKQRAEKLKEKLCFQQPLQVVDFDAEGQAAKLGWERKDVEVPEGGAEVDYTVLAYCDDKPDSKEVYSGKDNGCVLGAEVLTLGHTHHFTVSASLGDVNGEPSARTNLVVPPRPPSKPLPPKLSNRAKNTLTLRWNAPQDNGSPITHYELEWDQCRGEWEQLASDKPKQYKFTHKFPPSSSAQFRVRASNSVGMSPFSDPLDFKAGAGHPSVPQPPTLDQAGISHLGLQWTPPQCNGAEILSYTLEMKDPNTGYGYRPVYQGGDAAFTCTGLQRVKEYSFRLTATNEKGPSPASPSVLYRTLSSVPGETPAPFLKDKPTTHSLSVAWRDPADDGGLPVQSYLLQMSGAVGAGAGGGGASGELVEVYTGPEQSFLAEGLQPGRKYQARVCAVSAAGRGQFSPIVVLSTPATRPSPPLYLYMAGKPTQTCIPIQWGYPLADGGSPIISYAIEMSQDLSTNWSTVATVADPRVFEDPSTSAPTSPQPTLSHTITQLSPGVQYQFRVICRNAIGVGLPSVECAGQTAPGQPDCPIDMESSEVATSSAHLKWKVPDCHGSLVDSYQLQWFAELKSEAVSSSSTITNHTSLSNLSPATSYQARVKAQSAAGSSDWSLPVTFTTAPSVPSPPSLIKLIGSTPYSMLVAWNTPQANGSRVTTYYIEVGAESGHGTSHMIKVEASETQHSITDLKPNTTYRYRVQAENSIGKGLFCSYGSGTTLPPPPPPPHLALSSCSSHVLKVSWGKKPNRSINYMLHMAASGNQFHAVYQGTAVSHRITRLQPQAAYTLKVAAVSASGQGGWSDHVTFLTTPTPPMAPVGVALTSLRGGALRLEWQPVEFPYPLLYEAQYKAANTNQEYQQCYMGADCVAPVSLPASSSGVPSLTYEGRVRTCAACAVNGREELLWSSYSPPALCRWEKEAEPPQEEEGAGTEGAKGTEKKGAEERGGYGWTISVLLFVVVTLLTVVIALILGQVAV